MNILTDLEAAQFLGYDDVESCPPRALALLPAVDGYIKEATGRDWTQDDPIDPVAKALAQMLLNQWFETPSMVGKWTTELTYGTTNLLHQLDAKAQKLAAAEAAAALLEEV